MAPAANTTKAPARATASRRRAKTPAVPIYGVAPVIVDEAALSQAVAALVAIDPACMGHILSVAGTPPLRLREPGFAGLAAIVTSQQVSVASADAIYGRLVRAITPLDAPTFAHATEETLRICGLSSGKVRSLRAIAAAMLEGALDLDALAAMPAGEAHMRLCEVHGIGPWTADIFLLFCLGHPDAWPAGDVALQEAARLVLKLRARPDAARLTKIGERWRPYRGVAARLLWAYYKIAKERSGITLA